MAKMTKAQARKRIDESENKLRACFMAFHITGNDMISFDKLFSKVRNKLK